MTRRRLVVEADGGSRGNPGPAGFGAVVRDAQSGEVLDEVAAAIGTATNNVAEYSGLLAGLRAASEIDPGAEVEVRMDSKLVVEQMSGRWKVKHEDMQRLARQARDVLPPDRVRYSWVPREKNRHADRLANAAMDAAARGERWTRESRHGDRLDGDDAPVDVPPRRARPRYRVITGPSDDDFCERVSQALGEGYRLQGGAAVAVDGDTLVLAQALVRDEPTAQEVRQPAPH